GNNRVVARSDGTVVQTTHYYPYGMSFTEGTFADKQPYKYNGKELDTDNGLNLYDYDARQMDIVSGRFTSVDPMAEQYYNLSPYVYCMNNPTNLVDPTGTFSSKFGAWLYKLFNGGDQILKDTGGEYFVSTQSEYLGDEGGATVNRIFDWDGRNSGRNLKVEEQWNAYIADLKFQDICEAHGMEYVRVESRINAIAKMLQPATLTIMPVPFLKSGNELVNGISATVEETHLAKTPVGRQEWKCNDFCG
uniref:RHS repeat domain-containing protein n=1 Tax=Bacteroides sp. 1001136B_160425_E2 TaxID=2787083 RepID=UPI00189ED33D